MYNRTAPLDLTIQRRGGVKLPLEWTADGTAVNINGYTIAAQVWDKSRSVKYADFAVEYTDRPNGKFNISLTPAQTVSFTPNELYYDVKYKQPDNFEDYLIEGNIFVSQGYTTI